MTTRTLVRRSAVGTAVALALVVGLTGHASGEDAAQPPDVPAVNAKGADGAFPQSAETRSSDSGSAADGPEGAGGPQGAETESAAERYDWGDPVPEGSDEFDYGSEEEPALPDTSKWHLPGEGETCWAGHDGNGRRCAANSQVVGGILRQVGEANGDSAWIASKFGQRYGRWEARVRSEATAENNDRQYHPLLILWPDSERWPEDGEYDYLENMAPGEDCAEAFIHYPHDRGVPVQQEHAERCGVDLTQWHNVAVEWTPDHVRGFIDGEEWFSFSGGANEVRRCIQCAPSMHQTIQLDNFFGADMQSAVYEIAWTRAYSIEGVSEPAVGVSSPVG